MSPSFHPSNTCPLRSSLLSCHATLGEHIKKKFHHGKKEGYVISFCLGIFWGETFRKKWRISKYYMSKRTSKKQKSSPDNNPINIQSILVFNVSLRESKCKRERRILWQGMKKYSVGRTVILIVRFSSSSVKRTYVS